MMCSLSDTSGFNSQPPEGGWSELAIELDMLTLFQLTAARRRLVLNAKHGGRVRRRFNSQPPEGGWGLPPKSAHCLRSFNSQPPEGGWLDCWACICVLQ